MSRAFAAFGVALAAGVGIATSYVTFQPELQRQQEERQGHFQEQHGQEHEREREQRQQRDETQISRAIASDLREAREQVVDTGEGDGSGRGKGPAWKLRRALFGGGGGGGGGGAGGEVRREERTKEEGTEARREG